MQRVVPKGWRRPSTSFVRYYDDDVTVVAPPPSASSPRPLPPRPPRPRKRADSVTTIYVKVPPRSVQVEEITMLAIDVVVEEPAAVTTRRMIVPPSELRDVPPSVPYAPRALPQAPIAHEVTATRASMAAMALMFLLTSCAFALALAVPRLHRWVAAQTAAK